MEETAKTGPTCRVCGGALGPGGALGLCARDYQRQRRDSPRADSPDRLQPAPGTTREVKGSIPLDVLADLDAIAKMDGISRGALVRRAVVELVRSRKLLPGWLEDLAAQRRKAGRSGRQR